MTRQIPHINLFCLPYAGGNGFSYKMLSQVKCTHTKICTLDFPGHGTRIKEKCITDIGALTEDIIRSIENRIDEPYSFYGHSMGALLAYVVTRKIITRKLNPPLFLFLSGCEGPSIYDVQDLHLLEKDSLIDLLRKYQGSSETVLAHPELMEFYLPILRADFLVLRSFTYHPLDPLDIPLDIFIGSRDEISLMEAQTWEKETTNKTTIKVFDGGHFFIFDHYHEIMKIIDQRHANIKL